jgi:threonine dehydrogenase-like Zn-dependent dehydrogenase
LNVARVTSIIAFAKPVRDGNGAFREASVRQAVLYGAGDLRIEERALDSASLDPDAVYVETEVSALSTGTDLGNYLGDSTYVPGAPDYPRPVGYSNVGVVRRVGSAVRRLAPGQRVFSMKPHQSAYIARDSELLVVIPPEVPSGAAALAYLTHLGLAALRQAGYQAGENVAVVGLGVIGLCTVALARAMGAKAVGIANSDLRVKAALEVGADAAMLADDPALERRLGEVFGEAGADLVILTANPWPAYRLSVAIARYGGRVSVLGFPGRGTPPPDFNPLDPQWFYGKQLTLLGAGYAPRVECLPSELRFNTRRNLEYILDLMARGALRFESLITHRFPAARMKEAYDLAAAHSKSLTVALFEWS